MNNVRYCQIVCNVCIMYDGYGFCVLYIKSTFKCIGEHHFSSERSVLRVLPEKFPWIVPLMFFNPWKLHGCLPWMLRP